MNCKKNTNVSYKPRLTTDSREDIAIGRAEPGRRHCLKCTKIKERGGDEKGRKGRGKEGKEGKERGGEKKERKGETCHTKY